MAQYDGATVIPLEAVCRDFFSHLSPDNLVRKIRADEIELAIVQMEESQKAAKGIHLLDLAAYIDVRRAAARQEQQRIQVETGG